MLWSWLVEHCSGENADCLLEGCTGWRYVCEELAAEGVKVNLSGPNEVAALRGHKKSVKPDRADAKLLGTLLLDGRLSFALMHQRLAWPQRTHAQGSARGCLPSKELLLAAARQVLVSAEFLIIGRQYVDTALQHIGVLDCRVRFAKNTIGELRQAPTRLPGAAVPL